MLLMVQGSGTTVNGDVDVDAIVDKCKTVAKTTASSTATTVATEICEEKIKAHSAINVFFDDEGYPSYEVNE
jgi:hypothetical protein